MNLNNFKSYQDLGIPVKIIKDNVDIFKKILCQKLNRSMKISRFPSLMKAANITPVFKKVDWTEKVNYGPISTLTKLPKVLARCLHSKLYPFFDKIFSIQQCEFRKRFSTQHCIIKLIEKWRQFLDQSLVFGILLTDLSKAFDCLSHELLAAKLNAYGLETSIVRLIFEYLTNRKQQTKMGCH